MKDLVVAYGQGGMKVSLSRREPMQMYRLILKKGVWPDFVKVGRGVSIEWWTESQMLRAVDGDVCYRRLNIIHVNGVLMRKA